MINTNVPRPLTLPEPSGYTAWSDEHLSHFLRLWFETMNRLAYGISMTSLYFELRAIRECNDKKQQKITQSFVEVYSIDADTFVKNVKTQLMKPALKNTNVYFGLNPRNEKSGKESATALVMGVCVDIDYGSLGHKKASFFETKDATLQYIKSLDNSTPAMTPTMVVETGGGFQNYYIFKEVVQKKDFAMVKSLASEMSKTMNGDATTNPASVFRLPGTMNIKLLDHPRTCKITQYNGVLYDVNDLYNIYRIIDESRQNLNLKVVFTNDGGQKEKCDKNEARYTSGINLTRVASPYKQAILYGPKDKRFLTAYYKHYHKEFDGDRSALDQSIVNHLVYKGFSKKEIFDCYSNITFKHNERFLEEGQGERYLTYSLDKAKNSKIPNEKRKDHADKTSIFFNSIGNSQLLDGLYFWQKNKEGRVIPVRLGSPLYFNAVGKNDNKGWFNILAWPDKNKKLHKWVMPRELLKDNGIEYRGVLLSGGYEISGFRAREPLHRFLSETTGKKVIDVFDKSGWVTDDVFLPLGSYKAVGTDGEVLTILNADEFQFTPEGTLQSWRENVASLCVGNTTLLLCVCAAFAAPLLRLLGIESGGIHLFGGSSTGKTTAATMAMTVFGNPSWIRTWRGTANGIEATATAFNDHLLVLDEISQVAPTEAAEISYMLANQQGKQRSNVHGKGKPVATWRLLLLSTGEVSLADHLAIVQKDVRAGQDVRVLSIPITEGEYGVYNDLHGTANGAEFSNELMNRAHQHYGHAGSEFIRGIINNIDHTKKIVKARVDEFCQKNALTDYDGQVYRALRRFALIAEAGELATEYGLTGWGMDDCRNASLSLFRSWLSQRGGTVSHEVITFLQRFQRFFKTYGISRFEEWILPNPEDRKASIVRDRAGFRRHIDDRHDQPEEYYLFPEVLKKELLNGFNLRKALKILVEKGVVLSDPNGKSSVVAKPAVLAKSTRFYRITTKVWEDLCESDEASGDRK